MAATPVPEIRTRRKFGHFRTFFIRGLAILLPTVLTIWILIAAYQFVEGRIAGPINSGIRRLVIVTSPWPAAETRDFAWAQIQLLENPEFSDLRAEWSPRDEAGAAEHGENWTRPGPDGAPSLRRQAMRPYIEAIARQRALERWWNSVTVGTWVVMDLIGLLVAIVLIYLAGRLVGSFIGRRMYARGEEWLQRVPLFKQVYPYVKQVTDFLFGDETKKLQFSNVVAVQYPRMGLWSVGFMTGDTMRGIQDRVDSQCITVFIPSSPTPFTGYVITVPRAETIDLPITIDEALRFVVSGGVIIPPSQRVHTAAEQKEIEPSRTVRTRSA
jgi:uncharacterized membrane protein